MSSFSLFQRTASSLFPSIIRETELTQYRICTSFAWPLIFVPDPVAFNDFGQRLQLFCHWQPSPHCPLNRWGSSSESQILCTCPFHINLQNPSMLQIVLMNIRAWSSNLPEKCPGNDFMQFKMKQCFEEWGPQDLVKSSHLSWIFGSF